jgi:hypothetical protein
MGAIIELLDRVDARRKRKRAPRGASFDAEA